MRRRVTASAVVEQPGDGAPCPVHDGAPCTRCMPGVSGPSDCGLVWLMGHSPDLSIPSSEDHL